MRTIVYIDGFNLYYRALKYSSYKWLDIYKLFNDRICSSINSEKTELQIKFFTANILGSIASSKNSVGNQAKYHNALLKLYPNNIEIIKGKFLKETITARLVTDIPNFNQKEVEVLKLEEKKTDVNIAISMYRDVVNNACDQIIICSNDTDLVPAVSAVYEDFPKMNIGIVFPINEKSPRVSSKEFKDISHWEWKRISNSDLEYSQLPQKIPTHKKAIIKPLEW